MKKIIYAVIFIICFASCKKDKQEVDCNCGTISNEGIDGTCYWFEVRNKCSGNKKTWCFDQDIWENNSPGDHFCVTNVNSW